MTTLTQDLIQLLSVVPKDQGYFLAQSKPLFGDHIFGGQLLAQSIVSASLPAHSHSTLYMPTLFLRVLQIIPYYLKSKIYVIAIVFLHDK